MKKLKSIGLLSLKILVGIEVLWLLLGNVFLNTSIGPWAINQKPEKFSLQWRSGWTPYPARINVTDLKISIHTWSSDVEAEIDRVTTSIQLLPLFKKHLKIDGLSGGTANIRINREVPDNERATSEKGPGFQIDLTNITITKVDQLIFNNLKVNGGQTSVSGSLQFQIRGNTSLNDVNVVWEDANVELNQKAFTDTVNFKFEGDVSAFNPREDKGVSLIEKIDGNLGVNGVVGTLAPLKLFFPKVEWIEHVDGVGRVDIDVEIESGTLKPGSIIDVDATQLELVFLGYRASGSGRVDGNVVDFDGIQTGKIDVVFDNFQLARKDNKTALILGEGLSLRTRASNLGITDNIQNLEIILDIPESNYPDISVLSHHLPETLDVSVTGGSAFLSGHIEVAGDDREAQGNVLLTGKSLEGRFRNMDFRVDMELNSKVSGEQLDDFRVELTGTEFKLFNGIFENDLVEVEDRWWMTIGVPKGYADLSKPVELAADVELSMKDTRAVIALFAEVKEWISKFDGILTVKDVTGTAQVTAANQKLAISNLAIQGDRLDLMAELRAEAGKGDGIFWGKLGILSFGFERIGEEKNWKLINGRKWYEKKKSENW